MLNQRGDVILSHLNMFPYCTIRTIIKNQRQCPGHLWNELQRRQQARKHEAGHGCWEAVQPGSLEAGKTYPPQHFT